MPAATSPVALGTRGLAALVIAGLLLFAHQAGGVFAQEPDEELPPGTITNFRAESNQPYGFYVSWDAPTPTPTGYFLEWTSLANDNWTCFTPGCDRKRIVSGDTYLVGTTTSALVPGFDTSSNTHDYSHSFRLQALYRVKNRGYWKGPWTGGKAWPVYDRPGDLTLFEPTPRVNHAVPAILRDPDGARDQTWRWSRGDTAGGTFTEIPGATSETYIPTIDDLGKFLKLDATYKDSNVRDEFPEITPIKTLSVVSDDPVSLYTRTFASSLYNRSSSLGARGEPNLSQPFRTGPQPEGYMIKKVEVVFFTTPDYDPAEFEVKITTTPDVTEESTVATLINPGRIGTGKRFFRAPPGTWLAPATVYYLALLHHDPVHDGHYNVRCDGNFISSPIGYAGTGWEIGVGTNLVDLQAIVLDRDGTAVDVVGLRNLFDFVRFGACRMRITGESLRDVPYLTDFEFSGTRANAPTYDTGETIELTATFSEAVSVNASSTPYVPLTIGEHTRRATHHAAGSSATELVFRYTVVAADRDDDGISIAEDALSGTIHRAGSTTVVAATEHPEVPDDLDHLVNAAPTLLSAFVSSTQRARQAYSDNPRTPRYYGEVLEGYYDVGDELEFTLLFNMPVNVTGMPLFKFEMKSVKENWIQREDHMAFDPSIPPYARWAGYSSELSEGNRVVFTYTVGTRVNYGPQDTIPSGARRSEHDLDGIDFASSTDAIVLRSGVSIRDGVRPNSTTDAVLTFADPPRFAAHMINPDAYITNFVVLTDPKSGLNSQTYGEGEEIHFAADFSRPVRRAKPSEGADFPQAFMHFDLNGPRIATPPTRPGWFMDNVPERYKNAWRTAVNNTRIAVFNPELSTEYDFPFVYHTSSTWYGRIVFTYRVQSIDKAVNGLIFLNYSPLARRQVTVDNPIYVHGEIEGNADWIAYGNNRNQIVTRFYEFPTQYVHRVNGSLDPYADPEFPDADGDGVPDPVTLSVDEFTTGPVEIGSMGATDASEDRLTFTLSGADKAAFLETFTFETVGATSTVHLREGVTLDHEAKSSYTVTVGVSDGKNDNADTEDVPTVDATVQLTVNVNNLDEPAEVELSTAVPEVYRDVTATLKDDPDGGVTDVAWQWARGINYQGTFTDITGATSTTYVPQPADEDRYLNVKATYTDDQGAGKSASSTAPNETQPSPYTEPEFVITPPSTDPEKYFDDDDETSTSTGPVTLPLDENSPPGTVVGTMFAWDGDLDELTYTLGGTDIAAFNEHFEYDDETGEITVGEGVIIDYETRASYVITISVSDGEDGTGGSQATTTADATVDVTIAVTNLNEEGVVTLAPESPNVHVDVTASLEDDDGSVSAETWRWSKAGPRRTGRSRTSAARPPPPTPRCSQTGAGTSG